jgi:dephospho-CoA kinase
VFGDDEARSWLEGVLWPRVGERVASWRAGFEDADPQPRAAVVEVPLLFESGMESGFDATIAVIADEAIRETRAGARGHASVAERTGRQLSQEEKAARADHAIRNDGSVDALRSELAAVLERLNPQFA